MSKQNPTAFKSTSDNKAREDIRCGSDSSSACGYKPNIVHLDNSESKEFKGGINVEDLTHGSDSGFLSGPQSSLYDEQEELSHSAIGSNDFSQKTSKIDSIECNIKNSSEILLQRHENKEEEGIYAVDSGCIEEEDEYEESPDSAAKAERQSIIKQHITLQNQPHITTATSNNNTSTSEKMKLKHDVDSHLTERFSNISLQSGTVNNLNASGRATNAQTAPTTTTTTNKISESEQLPNWEQYFQQNDDGDTYLHLACIAGQENIVGALIRVAGNPYALNIKNDYGQTPLHLAALSRQKTILRMLLLAGAEAHLRDSRGNTALHLACMSGDVQCVSALTVPFSSEEINEAQRHFGFSQNKQLSYAEIRNYDGEYCVHLATEAGNLQILGTLVRFGADINAREGKGGYTPLHIVIENNNEELFSFLLNDCKSKLDVETTTFGRLTAYQMACRMKRSKMYKILEKYGAEPLSPPESEYEESSDDDEFE
ncbi:NF-kappa-B inhibitor cactus [Ceratitis capitata]|uniref:NF-kappa-B inhibitor cactus n=1 Tax=Ceratitis capitata TaxID=7213 RepID=UPI00032A1BB9|nr:NF-kappa-B inhibitor cactus [Ceratitis capitata]